MSLDKKWQKRETGLNGLRMRGRVGAEFGKHFVMITIKATPLTWLCINLRLMPSSVT